MQEENAVEASSLLESLLIDEKWLPGYLFEKKFDQYLFFDADLTSVEEVIMAIKDVLTSRVTTSPYMAVFSYTDKTFLTWMKGDEDWATRMAGIYRSLRASGDYNGLVLVDASMKYVVHQPNPVSMGVFAFSTENGKDERWRDISDNVRGAFFDLKDAERWLTGNTEHDLSLAESMGREYLEVLIKNYG